MMELYIVATPIGTLQDISPRALEVLQKVDMIACEDTRHTKQLLSHFKIHNHLISCHLHNEKEKMSHIFDQLEKTSGQKLALVSDAGTPAISDPGSFLIQEAHLRGLKIYSVPGPSALPCVLAASGFVSSRSLFVGFLSRKKEEQKKEWRLWNGISPLIGVFYESPQRVVATLEHLAEFQKEEGLFLEICVSREISKMYETHLKGPLLEILEKVKENTCRGEYAIAVYFPPLEKEIQEVSFDFLKKEIQKLVEEHVPLKQAVKKVALQYEKDPKELYKEYHQEES